MGRQPAEFLRDLRVFVTQPDIERQLWTHFPVVQDIERHHRAAEPSGLIRRQSDGGRGHVPEQEIGEAVTGELAGKIVRVVEAGAEERVGAVAAYVRSGLQIVLAARPGDAVVPLEGVDGQKPRLLLREAAEYCVAEPQALHESGAAAVLGGKRHSGVGGDRIARVLPALAVDLASIAGSKLIQQARCS